MPFKVAVMKDGKNLILVILFAIYSCADDENQPMVKAIETKNEPVTSQATSEGYNLDSLLLLDNTTSIMIAINDHILAKDTYDEDSSQLTLPQRYFMYIQELENEVNNGGFRQYFYNSSGDHAHETIVALSEIGAKRVLQLLQSAIDEFPNKVVPRDRGKRQIMLEKIETRASKVWEKLDEEFFTYPDDLNGLNLRYIKSHRQDFIK